MGTIKDLTPVTKIQISNSGIVLLVFGLLLLVAIVIIFILYRKFLLANKNRILTKEEINAEIKKLEDEIIVDDFAITRINKHKDATLSEIKLRKEQYEEYVKSLRASAKEHK